MPDHRKVERPDSVPRTVASFFSGGGGATLGLTRVGWEPVSFSEIEPYCVALLKTHWPEVPNIGDITTTRPDDIPDATLWMGGFPCQDVSLAGPRRGLHNDDGTLTRSGLAFTFLDLAESRRPAAILLENVDGLRSSNGGLDLARILEEVADIGYSVAFRILDSQNAGVPQRRRRLFMVALDLERYPDYLLPGEVLGITTSCARPHRQEFAAWQASAHDPDRSASSYSLPLDLEVSSQASDADRRGAVDGLPGRVDDSNPTTRFKVIGNGVVASMTQWIGARLATVLEDHADATNYSATATDDDISPRDE